MHIVNQFPKYRQYIPICLSTHPHTQHSIKENNALYVLSVSPNTATNDHDCSLDGHQGLGGLFAGFFLLHPHQWERWMLRNKQGNQPKVSEILLYNPRDPQETFAAYWPGRPNHRPFSRLGGGRLLPSIQMQNSRAILQYKESRLEKGDAVNKGRVCNRMT